jgi:hypothetical protein
VALPVDAGEAPLVGRVAELLWRLAELAELAEQPRPILEWIELLRAASAELLAVGRDDAVFTFPAEDRGPAAGFEGLSIQINHHR